MSTPADSRPIPPEKPLPMDCCDSGCARCVLDIYEDELEHYQTALAAWEARQHDPDE
ncbi:oxidoreductase-like domain-containing protein [Thermomonas sp.]|uniref:oxidoreductase-like domain-containing protein n=1 Tax=Thermomonas sp. TaxID=1971895 RepID=UPI002488BB54|nr:oxidoreductase-like domain-containing protein [Thermomonas sp.]MDI1253954.1 oxidoreductase-like domain-containing protein [Thermomonas sp.]